MNYNDIIALVRAGYTKEEISAMSAPQAQNQPAPAVIQPHEQPQVQNQSAHQVQQQAPQMVTVTVPQQVPAAQTAPVPAPQPAAQTAPVPAPQPAPVPAPQLNPNLPPQVNTQDPYGAILGQILQAVQAGNVAGAAAAPTQQFDEESYLANLAGYELMDKKG